MVLTVQALMQSNIYGLYNIHFQLWLYNNKLSWNHLPISVLWKQVL